MLQEKNTPENNADNLCRCPHCQCCFCTEADLKQHLKAYGDSKIEHAARFQRIHGGLEHNGFAGAE